MSGAVAQHTDFTGAVMRSCKLARADLRNAVLDGVNLDGADLHGADLRGASLKDAILVNVDMGGTEIAGAVMDGLVTDKIVGKPLETLGRPIELLLHLHEKFVATGGAEGETLDVSFYDLRPVGRLSGAQLTGLKANGAVLVAWISKGQGSRARSSKAPTSARPSWCGPTCAGPICAGRGSPMPICATPIWAR